MSKPRELSGGRKAKIYQLDEAVVRPINEHTPNIHKFLNFMWNEGATFIPKPLKLTKTEEQLSFIKGRVFHDPFPVEFFQDEIIITAAELLAKFHQYSKKYINQLQGTEKWLLPTLTPIEVMCHGDYAPYNIVIQGTKAKGIIDFDTLHPGSILWDVSYAAYRWAPLSKEIAPNLTLPEQIKRAKKFCDAYGLSSKQRQELVKTIILRLEALMNFMQQEADHGNSDFQQNIAAGHLLTYETDIAYLKNHELEIISGIE